MQQRQHDLADAIAGYRDARRQAQHQLAGLIAEARSHRTSAEHRCTTGCDCVGTPAQLLVGAMAPDAVKAALLLAVAHLAERGGLGSMP